MPEISRFFGIVIGMFYDDHLPPHFHARYGRERVMIAIHTMRVLRGQMSPRALRFVTEWATIYSGELMENWRRAEQHQPLIPIPPLE
jgi:hypothetical protein